MTEAARFWSMVDKGEDDDCWIWKGHRSPFGYGEFRAGGRKLTAHRYAWALSNGPIPDNLKACHRCDNPSCVNPSHLFLGTQTENMADCTRKGRHAAKLTPDEVREIRALYETGGLTQKEIGSRYGVTQAAIHWIVVGRNWAHVR